jgi:hypothetical protein
MNRLHMLERRRQALVLRCEQQRSELARESARLLAWLHRAESAAHTARRLLSHPLVPIAVALLAAGAGRRSIGKWARRVSALWRGMRLAGTVMAAARFAPLLLAILRSRRAH